MPDIHRAAREGFAAKAESYVTGRPDYPREITDWLRGELGLGEGATVLDLGSGTGKFVPYLQNTGARVLAVEPVDAMRARLVAAHPGVVTTAGSAETIPLEDGLLDAVVCAQSFHWFANAAALAEIRRVLRPGGALGLIWNVRDESVPWVAALSRLIAPYEGDAPRYHTGAWRRLFPAEGFGALREHRFPHAHVGPAEAVIVERTMSVSFIAALPEDERRMVADRVRRQIADTPELAGKAEVAFPYETCAFSSRTI